MRYIKKGCGHLHKPPEIRYQFIDAHRFEFRVEKMCQVLEVSRSGYYAWLKRPKSKRDRADEKLLEEIKKSHQQSRGLYGVRRITKDLNKRGIRCSRNQVHRLMKENNIISRRPRKYKATTNSKHNYSVADNILNQDFKADRPNKVWVTELPTFQQRKAGSTLLP